MIPIVILAAGSSSRMRGGDKLLETVADTPLLRVQATRAMATGHPVYVALPSADHSRAAVLTDLDVTVLDVPDAAEGMSGTMRGAIAQLPEVAAFMILLGDLVAIDTTDLQSLFTARTKNPNYLIWRAATSDGMPGHPIIFDGSLRGEFARLSGDGGGEAIVKPLQDRTHLTRLRGNRARLDLDTPEDWENWRRSDV